MVNLVHKTKTTADNRSAGFRTWVHLSLTFAYAQHIKIQMRTEILFILSFIMDAHNRYPIKFVATYQHCTMDTYVNITLARRDENREISATLLKE